MTHERRAVDQGCRRVHSGPLADPFDKSLLDRLREHVRKSFDLSPVFVGDHGHLVAALEDRSAPAGEAVDLAGQFGFEVAHEGSKLAGAFGDREDVEMIREN